MDLTLILGPMKSGKSFDLISYFAPLKYTDIPHVLYQSSRNVRDEHISSRNGVIIEAKKVCSLADALDKNYAVVGVDELHMFDPNDVAVVKELLKRGVKVVAAGLDIDYQGKMFEIIKGLLELGPKEVKYKRSVCELCRQPNAVYSQVFSKGVPLIEGMPPVIPDDGTFTYQPVCRNCFVKKY
ncbi:MAG: Thymidine kinase [Candidatus Magasanikbacteria bacterium GW2011_GWA2_40_10]|uniref:Thymidine kinase n=1 Tax=Candidatus Magasanikbacteria bacterium GW2011_GWA2_40_10 TaxID=1619037 RepID=A0A0G0QDZ3_9BACT|nr:MAG: Thymidine kinase [Candidatus Magasanikbacteria bacterium GW2011_GWA2_40_10]